MLETRIKFEHVVQANTRHVESEKTNLPCRNIKTCHGRIKNAHTTCFRAIKGKTKRIGTQNCVPSRVILVIPKKVHMHHGDLHELDNPKSHY